MSRYRPLLLSALITAAVGTLLTGMPMGLLMFALVSIAAGGIPLLFRGTAIPDGGWAPPMSVVVEAKPPGARHGSHVPSSPRAVIRAIGRFESGRLATSPWFGIGVGFCIIIAIGFSVVFESGEVHLWPDEAMLAPWFAHPLVGLTVLAVHRNTTRAGRDDADELLDTCPTDPARRTVGFLTIAWVPVATFAAFYGAYLAILVARGSGFDGPFGFEQILDVVGAFALCVGGVALGVALGRWARFGLAPVVAVVAVAFLTLGLATTGDPDWNPLAELSTVPPMTETNQVFTARPAGWHVVWLLALTGLVAAAALLRHRRDRNILVLATASVTVAVVAGLGATRPMSGEDAATIAGRVTDPSAHQTCTTGAGGRLEVCTFEGYDDIVDVVLEPVSAVVAALPAEAGTIAMRQRYPQDATLADLPPEVRRRLPGGLPKPAANEIPLGFAADGDTVDRARFAAAFTAVGLPTDPPRVDTPEVIAGQARGVVALWLATRGLPPDEARRSTTARDPGSSDPFERGLVTWEECGASPVVWSAQDLEAARVLMEVPDEAVRRVLGARWRDWTDARTGTDDLLAALSLPPVGPFDEIEPRSAEPLEADAGSGETLGC